MQGDGVDDSALTATLSGNDQDVMDPMSRTAGVASDKPKIVNGVREDGMSESSDAPSVRGASRSTSGKIASLRAAFENHGTDESVSTKRRFGGSERSGERIEEYEAEINRWRQELEKEKGLRQAFEQRCNALEESMNGKTDARPESSNGVDKGAHDDTLEQLSLAQREAEANKNEAANAQRQLADLKRNISTATRIENQVTDTSFAREMENLYHELQNWIVNNFRRSKTDLSQDELRKRIDSIAEPQHAELLKDIYATWTSPSKLPYLQATSLVYIMEIFDEPLLFGLPSQEWRRNLRRALEGLSTVLEPAAFNKWRATTLSSLQQAPSTAPSVDSAVAGMSQMISLTLTALTDVEQTDARMATLITIVKKAANLSHLFRVQRAHYRFILPDPGSNFDAEYMEDLAQEEDESTRPRPVRCATFPAVIKIGDEHGESPHTRNVVAKAKVLC